MGEELSLSDPLNGAESDFSTAVERVKNLADKNPYVAGVLRILEDEMLKGERPQIGHLRERQDQQITEDEFARVISWIALDSNFDTLEEVDNWLERFFANVIDKWNQPISQEPNQPSVGTHSYSYRAAKASFIEALKPYTKEHMLTAPLKQIKYWSQMGILEQGQELTQSFDYGIVDADSIKFYVWEGCSIGVINEIDNAFLELRKILGSIDLPLGTLVPMHVLLIPNGQYIEHGTLGAADGRKGDRMIIRADIRDINGLVAHEAMHAVAAQVLGESKSVMMMEAFALGLGKVISPKGSVNNMMYGPGYKQALRRYQLNKDIGLTHTEMLEKEDIFTLPPVEVNSYAYRHAQMFFDFFYENHSLKKFIEIYRVTCQNYLYSSSQEDNNNPQRAKPLVLKGVRSENATEHEIVEQAIKKVFKEKAPEVLNQLEEYYKARTHEQAMLSISTSSQ